MIGTLHGRVIRRRWPIVVIETGGVGYEVRVPLGTFESLPSGSDEASLEILTLLRSESLQLYGFASEEEKLLFESLLGVSGVGPRIALAVLSGIRPATLVDAVRREDASLLESVPGIGRKTARRIVLDLKDRLDDLGSTGSGRAEPALAAAADGMSADAVAALENLGYRRSEAERAVSAAMKVDAPADLPALIRGSLGRLRGSS
jgi:Holliday junction DNA helicase RuvA